MFLWRITLGKGPSGPTLIVVKTVRYRTNSPQTWVSYKKTVANGAIAPIGGFAFAIQPHREVRPESGLSIYEIYDMKACRITTLFSGRGGEEEEDKGEKGSALLRQGASYDHSPP